VVEKRGESSGQEAGLARLHVGGIFPKFRLLLPSLSQSLIDGCRQCIMFFSLQVDRGNLVQAVSDNLLDDLGLSTDGIMHLFPVAPTSP